MVIKYVNLRIKWKDFVFILGFSGSGKSMFLCFFYGDLKFFSGKLEVCNINMNNVLKVMILDLCKNIGVVF